MSKIDNRGRILGHLALILALVAAGAYYWYSATEGKVSIVGIDAPEEIGVLYLDRMNITLHNYKSEPADVNIEIENALIDANGTGIPLNSILWISDDGTQYDQSYPTKNVPLEPGNNTIRVYLGSMKSGTYDVSIRVSYKGRIVDEETIAVKVMPSELSLDVNTRKATLDDRDIYGVDISLLDVGMGRTVASSTRTTIQIFDEKNGELLYEEKVSQVGHISNWNISEWNISGWTESPSVVIEIARNESSEKDYLPLEAVIKGKPGDNYRINVTTLWEDQVLHKEVIIPPA